MYINTIAVLPPQMIPLSKKDDKWKKRCIDSLEQIARNQYWRNLKLVENYEMIKGRFIFSHYFGEEGYQDMIQNLTKEFELPNYLRHYDIISPVINTMSGEFQKRPDIFRVKAMDSDSTNEYLRKKTQLLSKFVSDKITSEINSALADMGLDPNKKDFSSQEEQQQYQQQIQQVSQSMTPPQIEKYMQTDFRTAAEEWGEAQLELDKQRFKLDEKQKKEFEDMLVADRCYRHFRLKPNGYDQETWNPINVFFHKSPECDYIEDGDYVGRILYYTISDIVDRYGYLMTHDQLKSLEELNEVRDERWDEAEGTDYVYKNYAMPFQGFPAYDILRQTNSFNNIEEQGIPFLDNNFFTNLYSGTLFNNRNGFYLVTECYWKSQKKIGLVTYIDPETGLLSKDLVDENFIVPPNFVEVDSTFSQDQDVNTVLWTWVNEIWGGIKINITGSNKILEDIYLNVKPLEFQFKGDINPYEAKLPVCGQVFSLRNSMSMSMVDMMKPYQIGFNVAMNQVYQFMEKEIGMFLVMDINLFPNAKDWGGENAWEKWMLIARNIGILPADTSPQNARGAAAAANGAFPKILNLDLSAQFISRMKLAAEFKQLAESQVGFNEYRMGNFASTSTATGIEQGQEKSYAQTESYFTMFSNYLRRCYRMNLDISQYVQSQNKDITLSYVKSDLSNAVVKTLAKDIMLSDLHIYVTNSQEQIRALETIRQFALENNTSGLTPPDIISIITSNSPAEIKKQIEISFNKTQELQQQEQQLKQQELQQQQQLEQAKLQQASQQFEEKLQNNIQVAEIAAHAKIATFQPSDNTPEQPDNSGQQKLALQQQTAQDKAQQDQRKHELEIDKAISDREYQMKSLDLKAKEIQGKLQVENKKLQVVKTMKGKNNN
jgi:hypothetical protein